MSILPDNDSGPFAAGIARVRLYGILLIKQYALIMCGILPLEEHDALTRHGIA